MFHVNIKVMFKVNGYELQVRNTSETTKQVSLHYIDGSMLCSYPLHDYYREEFNYLGLNSCITELVNYARKATKLTIDKGTLKLVARIQKHNNGYRLDVSDLNFAGRFLKYYSGNYSEIQDRLINNIHSYLGINKEYAKELIKLIKVVEYKGNSNNW